MRKSEYICDICGAKTTTDEINSGKSTELVLRLIEENQLNKSEVKRILEDDTNL